LALIVFGPQIKHDKDSNTVTLNVSTSLKMLNMAIVSFSVLGGQKVHPFFMPFMFLKALLTACLLQKPSICINVPFLRKEKHIENDSDFLP
jgi:hypothetical protein